MDSPRIMFVKLNDFQKKEKKKEQRKKKIKNKKYIHKKTEKENM